MQRVVIVDSLRRNYFESPDVEVGLLQSPDCHVELLRVNDASELVGRIEDADVIISWYNIAINAELIGTLRRCKGVVRAAVGYDNIDVEHLRARGIPLACVPDYGTEEVADHTIALLLAAARNLCASHQRVKNGEWEWRAIGKARRLRGRKLGIIGLGRIGSSVARRAQAFGLSVSFYDPYVVSGTDKIHGVHRFESLSELLPGADYLTIHTPLNEETRHILNAEAFSKVKPGVTVINSARGALIETSALLSGLESGRIGLAALDVLEAEPEIPESLLRSEKVVFT